MIALSEAREALVGAPDDASDERMAELRAAASAAEKEMRECLVADAEEDAGDAGNADDGDDDGVDAEERERREIVSRATLAGYIGAAATVRPLSGAEAEAAEAYGCPGAIPLEMFGQPRKRKMVEERAATPAPAVTDVVFEPTIHPIFDYSVAGWLMCDMPMVPPGVQQYPSLSTSLTAGMKAKGAEAAETAAAYGALLMASPKRIGGGYRLQREDLAVLPRMESDLNRNIQSVMADTLDAQILNGDPAADAANLNGILTQLADPNDPAAVVTFDSALQTWVDQIEGKLARSEMDVKVLAGTDTYKKLATLFRSNDSPFGPSSNYLRMHTGGLMASNRLPAQSASKVQSAVAMRTMSPDRTAVLPIWQGVEAIRDETTDARKGEIAVTLFALVGGVVLTRADAYQRVEFKLA